MTQTRLNNKQRAIDSTLYAIDKHFPKLGINVNHSKTTNSTYIYVFKKSKQGGQDTLGRVRISDHRSKFNDGGYHCGKPSTHVRFDRPGEIDSRIESFVKRLKLRNA